jgi:hypothetical protein
VQLSIKVFLHLLEGLIPELGGFRRRLCRESYVLVLKRSNETRSHTVFLRGFWDGPQLAKGLIWIGAVCCVLPTGNPTRRSGPFQMARGGCVVEYQSLHG